MNKKVMFVSMPRSGTHWFRHIAELLLKRPADNQAYYYNGEEPWCNSNHGVNIIGNNLKIKPNFVCHMTYPTNRRILYLHRNLPDVVFSWMDRSGYRLNKTNIINMTLLLCEHKDNYFNDKNNNKIYTFTYQDIVNRDLIKLTEVFDFIGVSYDAEIIISTIDSVTKQTVRQYSKNKKIADPSKQYQDRKKAFLESYKDLIQEIEIYYFTWLKNED